MDPRKRRRNLTLAAIAGVLIGIALVWYLVTYGLTLGPIMDPGQALLDWFTGLFELSPRSVWGAAGELVEFCSPGD